MGLGVAFVKVRAEGFVRQWLFGVSPYLLISNLALQMLIYWALVGVAHALDAYGRSRQQAAEVQARLGGLSSNCCERSSSRTSCSTR